MTKTSRLKKRLAANINRTYRIFLVLFFSLMAVFLTSKMWLPNDMKIQNSSMGTTRTTTSGLEITLKNWQYNPSEHLMEAAFSYQNSDDTDGMHFIPSARTDTQKNMKMDVSVPYSNNGFLVVQIRNVPQDWNAISLWIDSKGSQITDILSDTDSSPTSESSNSDPDSDASQQGANFFCDIRKVTVNRNLKSQNKLYYSLQSVDNEISSDKKQIALTQKKIDEANTDISQLNFDISALKSNQKYQTPDEVSQSNTSIQDKTSQISDLKNNITQGQQDVNNGKQKLKKLQQKWNDIRNGKFKETDPESSSSTATSAPDSKNSKNSSESIMTD